MSGDMGKRNMTGLFMIFLGVVIGLALTPTITDRVDLLQVGAGKANMTGAAWALASQIPLFWIILVMSVGAYGVLIWLKGVY